jgi:hypothetical protein
LPRPPERPIHLRSARMLDVTQQVRFVVKGGRVHRNDA